MRLPALPSEVRSLLRQVITERSEHHIVVGVRPTVRDYRETVYRPEA